MLLTYERISRRQLLYLIDGCHEQTTKEFDCSKSRGGRKLIDNGRRRHHVDTASAAAAVEIVVTLQTNSDQHQANVRQRLATKCKKKHLMNSIQSYRKFRSVKLGPGISNLQQTSMDGDIYINVQ